jgi:hypothetical protein
MYLPIACSRVELGLDHAQHITHLIRYTSEEVDGPSAITGNQSFK